MVLANAKRQEEIKGIQMGKKDVKFFIHKQQDCIHRNLVEVAQSCPTLYDPTDCTVHGILQARILEWVVFSFPRGSSQARSPALQAASLPAEPQGKPKNTGVGGLSVFQVFLTQELNRGLLNCRWILY